VHNRNNRRGFDAVESNTHEKLGGFPAKVFAPIILGKKHLNLKTLLVGILW
jgi:hypothetical protein